jgi:hypothetical protein
MAFTNVLPGSGKYPDIRLRWAPTSQPTDASQTYVDITDRLRSWAWEYGRKDEVGQFEAGNGHVVLDNSDRALDPSLNAGAWFGNIKPRRVFEIVARWNAVEYPICVAYARGFPQSYPSAGFDKVVKVDLVDAFAILQGVDLVIGFTRPEELSGDRIEAVLDAIGVPAGLRDIDPGTVTVAAIDVDSPGTSGLAHAKAVAVESEMGQLFVAKDGKVTFHDYSRRLNGTVAHAFTDNPSGTLRYGIGVEPDFDEAYLWNYIRAAGAAGNDAALVAEDSASQDDYFILTKTISTQLVSGSEIQQVADRFALRYAQPELRAPALPLSGARSPSAMWPVLLGLEVSDQVSVEVFATSSDPMLLTQNVEGIRHSCVPGGPWVTSVPTSPADTNEYLELNDATLSELDDDYALT